MRLLHTKDFVLRTFYGSDVPKYAILSHTWGREDEEVSFQELHDPTAIDRPGYKKIRRSCEIAADLNCEYVWIDTCCIDKTNPTELSEAINSMFNWYKNSTTCLVYLADVSRDTEPVSPGMRWISMEQSRWFTRGWTLQELLAPKNLCFYDHAWNIIGPLVDYSDVVRKATGISWDNYVNLDKVCVGVKMSWLASRKTTRVEDMAYCMLGLFNLNLPLIYGEGDRAFLRLQREIFQTNPDETLFAWWDSAISYAGLLAPYPSCYRNSRDVRSEMSLTPRSPPFHLTNRGLSVKVDDYKHCTRAYSLAKPCEMSFNLRCFDGASAPDVCTIPLVRIRVDEWVRNGRRRSDRNGDLERCIKSNKPSSIYIPLSQESAVIESILAASKAKSNNQTKIIVPHSIMLSGVFSSLYSKTTPVQVLPANPNSPPLYEIQTHSTEHQVLFSESQTLLALRLKIGKHPFDLCIANIDTGAKLATYDYGDGYSPRSSGRSGNYLTRYEYFIGILQLLAGGCDGNFVHCCVRTDALYELFSFNKIRVGGTVLTLRAGTREDSCYELRWSVFEYQSLTPSKTADKANSLDMEKKDWQKQVDTLLKPIVASMPKKGT